MRVEEVLLDGGAAGMVPPPLLRLLGFLDGEEVQRFLESAPRCLGCVRGARRRFQREGARLALAAWCARHVWLRFESFYQEKETQTIARSSDSHVPPRVRSYWSERGKVTGARILLRSCELPRVHEDAVSLRFSGGEQPAQRPMLTNVAQANRRIYSVVSLIVRKNDDDLPIGEEGAAALEETSDHGVVVLRKYTYIKEFHEWEPLNPMEKRAFDESGARCRHDLVSLDGSVAFELDVPSGADAQVDYYLVKKCVVHLHLQELLQRFFATIRPVMRLPVPPAERRPCHIKISFRRLDGRTLGRHVLPGELTVEQQGDSTSTDVGSSVTQVDDESPSRANTRRPAAATGMEAFEIITCSIAKLVDPGLVLPLPKEPGYCLLQVRDVESRQLYFYTTALHRGAQRHGMHSALDLRWLPGVLEFYPTLDSLHRRALKGRMHLSTHLGSDALHDLSIVAQHLTSEMLERYAASIDSYTRAR